MMIHLHRALKFKSSISFIPSSTVSGKWGHDSCHVLLTVGTEDQMTLLLSSRATK